MHNNNNTITNTKSHLPSEGVIEETSYDEDNKSLPDETLLTPLEKHISTLQNETEMNITLSNLLHFNKSQLLKQPTNTLYQSYIFLKDRKEDIKTLTSYFTSQHLTTTSTLDDYVSKITTTKSELKWVRKEQNENMNHKQQLMSDNLGGLACNYFRASGMVVRLSTISRRRSFGITINVSTAFFKFSIPLRALFIRCFASKRNGFVTTPTVRIPISFAI